jgi:hypothetical protein
MLIIASCSYAVSELCAEYGDLPPSFLPIGNRRLYEWQVEWAKNKYSKIVLTLPEKFNLHSNDLTFFEKSNVVIFYEDDAKSLGVVIKKVLDKHSPSNERVDILFGDTLFPDLIPYPNSIVLGKANNNYKWYRDAEGLELVWAGFFSFNNSSALLKILKSEDDFLRCVRLYDSNCEMLNRVALEEWYDFGHLQTYIKSKQKITTQRHFNELSIKNGVVEKRSKDRKKMQAESIWFESLPYELRLYVPQYLGQNIDGDGYRLEYLPLSALNELYVFGRLPNFIWKEILNSCFNFLEGMNNSSFEKKCVNLKSLYLDKTIERLKSYEVQLGKTVLLDAWEVNGRKCPQLLDIVNDCWLKVKNTEPIISLGHGDYCFSNILYDFRQARIKVIDPRGLDPEGRITAVSDMRYDLAKLAHSIVGKYDLIIAGHYDLTIVNDRSFNFNISKKENCDLDSIFLDSFFLGRSIRDCQIYPIMVLLFLGMIPLHVDRPDRQFAFLANALKLYAEV